MKREPDIVIPENWEKLPQGTKLKKGDLWFDPHLRKFKPPLPKSYNIPVMGIETIIRESKKP